MRLACLATALCAALHAQDPAPPRPHVVLILADDLGWGDPQCYAESSKVPTPQLDRLAEQGTRFTDAHSPSSVCTPTRYGLLTGRYAWRTALRRSVLWPWDPPLLEEARVTLPELLSGAGYRTACIGKWHLGWHWPIGEQGWIADEFEGHTIPAKERAGWAARIAFERPLRGGPLDHGFAHYYGDDVPNFPPYAWIEDDRVVTPPTTSKPKGMFGHAGPAAPGWDLATVLPTLAQRAAGWLESEARTHDDPLFLFLSLTAPHTPIAPSPRFRGASGAGAYGDFVVEVDWVVGQVLGSLERAGIAEDTLVVFTSDNGSPARNGEGMSGPVGSVIGEFEHDPSGPWRGLKSDAWEAGHRVPYLVRWPGRVPAGRVSDAPLIHTDLYRTLATLLALDVPEGAAEDSFDQSAEFLGRAEPQARDHLIHHSGKGTFAIRVGTWKLILGKGSGGFSKYTPPEDAPPGQLYDLAADPYETTNLYATHPEVVARLGARLEALRNTDRTAPE